VSSAQIEGLISQCLGVSEVAVIGVKDDKWGERPLALVIRGAQTGDDLSERQIKAHLNAFADAGVVSKYGIRDEILFVKALPTTSVGQFNKELREKYGKL
jgi:acyl-CoA synthetase (AMP-forming)/AMP-acid ligase II